MKTNEDLPSAPKPTWHFSGLTIHSDSLYLACQGGKPPSPHPTWYSVSALQSQEGVSVPPGWPVLQISAFLGPVQLKPSLSGVFSRSLPQVPLLRTPLIGEEEPCTHLSPFWLSTFTLLSLTSPLSGTEALKTDGAFCSGLSGQWNDPHVWSFWPPSHVFFEKKWNRKELELSPNYFPAYIIAASD